MARAGARGDGGDDVAGARRRVVPNIQPAGVWGAEDGAHQRLQIATSDHAVGVAIAGAHPAAVQVAGRAAVAVVALLAAGADTVAAPGRGAVGVAAVGVEPIAVIAVLAGGAHGVAAPGRGAVGIAAVAVDFVAVVTGFRGMAHTVAAADLRRLIAGVALAVTVGVLLGGIEDIRAVVAAGRAQLQRAAESIAVVIDEGVLFRWAAIALITVAVVVLVRLRRVGIRRAVVARVAHPIAVAIFLAGVRSVPAVVAVVTQAIAIGVT